ncbi:MAG: hypothetical protein MJZ37_03110 [Bacilli bacterium]|nr:hypothetical protein [Bacilli bacterium]
MENDEKRVTDAELLLLIAQGDLKAKETLDERYYLYLRSLTRNFCDTHSNYGYSFEDFFNSAVIGYCKARNRFCYEKSDAFYPFVRVWAECEMRSLGREGNRFYLNEDPNKFVSLDITYRDNEDPLSIGERFGAEDHNIETEIIANEVMEVISNKKYRLTPLEKEICIVLASRYSPSEARERFDLTYVQYCRIINSIRTKIGNKLKHIIK